MSTQQATQQATQLAIPSSSLAWLDGCFPTGVLSVLILKAITSLWANSGLAMRD